MTAEAVQKIQNSFPPAVEFLTFYGSLTSSLRLIPWCSKQHAHWACSPLWRFFLFVLDINRRVTRRRNLDLVKSLDQLSFTERGDNAFIFRDFWRLLKPVEKRILDVVCMIDSSICSMYYWGHVEIQKFV